MRRLLLGLAVTAAGAWATAARADDPPHMELVRGLRAEGMPDLAMEYLTKLAADKGLPEAVAVVVPLERAKTNLQIAAQESDDARRLARIDDAEKEFKAFLAKSGKHPLAPQASLELARLEALRGDAQLAKSRRQEDDKAKAAEAAQAQPFFDKAAKMLDAAAKKIDESLAALAEATSPADEAVKAELTRSKYQAMLERGINLFNQSKTTSDNTKIGKYVEDARKQFEKLADDEAAKAVPQAYAARAWAYRCYVETQQSEEADKTFELLDKEKSPAAAEAQRLVRFFRIRKVIDEEGGGVMEKKTKETKFARVRRLGEEWLARYRGFRNTFEGTGVVWAMGINYEAEARRLTTFDPKTGAVKAISGDGRAFYVQAEKYYKELADGDNEYSERAARNRMRCIIAATYDRRDNVANLQTFDELFRNAQLKLYQLGQKLKDADDDGERDKVAGPVYAEVVNMIDRGLKKVKSTDSPKDVLAANLTLAYVYTEAGEYDRAVELGEKLAKQNLRSAKGVQAAAYALRAATKAMTAAREAGKSDEAARWQQKLAGVADFMEKTFPTEPATDQARHQIGFLAVRDEDPVTAAKTYHRVTPGYSQFQAVRLEQGSLAYVVAKAKGVPEAEKKAVVDQAVADLTALPQLTTGTPEALKTSALAKLQLGYLYLLPERREYAKAEKVAADVKAAAAKAELGEEGKTEVTMSAQALETYAQQFRANLLIKEGKFADAAKLYDPVVASAPPAAQGKAADRARAARREMMILALRAKVQNGEIEPAQAVLEKINTEETAGGLGGSITQTLLAVVTELQGQINELKRKAAGDPAAAEQFQKTNESLATFLDTIAKRKDVTDDMRLFLAQGYFTLDKFDRASELLAQVAEPKGEDVAQQKRHRAAQFLLAKSYRLGSKFADAQKLLAEFIGTPEKKGWGYNNLDVRKERIFLLEDQNKFREALAEWQQLQKAFTSWQRVLAKPRALAEEADPKKKEAVDAVWGLYQRLFRGWQNLPALDADPASYGDDKARKEALAKLQAEVQARPEAKDAYEVIAQAARAERPKQLAVREAYCQYYAYMIRCIYKSNLKSKTKDAALAKLAATVVKFEKGNPDMGGQEAKELFTDMFENDPGFKKAYIAAGGKLFESEAASATN